MTSKKRAGAGTRVAKSPGTELERIDEPDDPAELLNNFLGSRSDRTRQTYVEVLRNFAQHLGVESNIAALAYLLSLDGGKANKVVRGYVVEMRTRVRPGIKKKGLAPATVNQRLYTLRALIKMARTDGYVNWNLEVEGDKRKKRYKDTKGPGRGGFVALVDQAADDDNDARRTRNVAILRLGYDMALRRGEVVSLDYPEHVDMEGGVLWILGKGRDEREPVTVPRPSRVALARWIEQRGDEPGPFFLSRDRAGKGDGRLTGRGIDQMIKKVGLQLGMVKIRFHGLRHAAITDALDATNGDVALVQQFSRHMDPRTVMVYRDNTQDDFGRIAELVAGRTVKSPDEES